MFQKPENPLDKMTSEQQKLLTPDDIAKIKANHNWHLATWDLGELSILLHADLMEIARIAAQDNPTSDWYKRSLFRALFAWIEGYVYGLKQVTLRVYEAGIYTEFTAGELSFLLEETYNMDDKSNISTGDKFPKTGQNLLFALSSFARVHNFKIQIDKGGNDWRSFDKALKVRHRLTHPKSVSRLSITDDELKTALHVVAWFGKLVGTTGREALIFIENLRKTQTAEHEPDLKGRLERASRVFAQAGVIERAENLLRQIAKSENEAGLPRDEISKLAEELNLLKKEIAAQAKQ